MTVCEVREMALVEGATVEATPGGYVVSIPAKRGPAIEVDGPVEAVKAMIQHSGVSGRAISAKMGKSAGYVGSAISHDGDIGTSTLAKMAQAADYELILRGHDGEIVIRP